MALEPTWTAQVEIHCIGCRTANWRCPHCGAPGSTTAPLLPVTRREFPITAMAGCRRCGAIGRLALHAPSPCPTSPSTGRDEPWGPATRPSDPTPTPVPQKPAQGAAGTSEANGGRWKQPQLSLVPSAVAGTPAGQQQGNADAGVVDPRSRPATGTFGHFKGGCVGFDRVAGGELLRAEDPDVPRRSWREWQAWHPSLRKVARISPTSSLKRMGVPLIRKRKATLLSDLALLIVVAELGLPPLGLPGEDELRAQLLAPPDQVDQAS
jgi:hypothetical protein